MRDVTARLKELYRTDRADVLLMTSSGTGGLESAVQNVLLARGRGLRPARGVLLRAVARLASAMGLAVHTMEDEWGSKIDPAKVADALAEHPGQGRAAHAVGDLDRRDPAVEELARVASDAGAMVVVDVVSSLGAVPVRVRRLGHRRRGRRLAEGAQRIPGIAFVAMSDRAWEAHGGRLPRFYFDWATSGGSRSCPTPRTRGRRRSA